MRPPEDDDEGNPGEIHVWSCNWLAIEIFQRCELSATASGFAVVYRGISATELRNALDGVDLPPAELEELKSDVRYLGRIVSTAINDRTAAHAASRS